ncbi:hypothetical protein [Aquimarina sp. AU474]|uniref:hypothetical protein n=1 Tax=Aquimarina sp. AU474 TaxID=2108529 RepID=UPI000D68ECC9|nr:hypothetical protein [Aquimarina sp. AU474]
MQSKCFLTVIFILFSTLTTFATTVTKETSFSINTTLFFDQENPEKLVGKWMMDGDDETYIELKSNGVAVEKSIGEPSERYWSVKDNKLCLKANQKQGGTEMCVDFELYEDTLTLTMKEMKLPYTRFKE